MIETADKLTQTCAAAPEDEALERRLLRSMCASVAVAVLVSAALAPWRVTAGLLLGGTLSIFNHHWLRTSVAAVLGGARAAGPQRPAAGRFVLRYFVVAAVVAAAVAAGVVSLPATLAGMCSFVAAVFVEASAQLYHAIIHREDT